MRRLAIFLSREERYRRDRQNEVEAVAAGMRDSFPMDPSRIAQLRDYAANKSSSLLAEGAQLALRPRVGA